MTAIKRALISVSDKQGLAEFVTFLASVGVEILSTGGTAKFIQDVGVSVTMVADYTGAPEILDGRVKTLHPKIHGGLLGRSIPSHQAEMKSEGIETIDLVVVNLYPFEQTVASGDVNLQDAIEKIDIGGPSMLRSAAKNHERVTVLVDPKDYGIVLAEMKGNDGRVCDSTRYSLATKVFSHTAAYDGAIAAYLSSINLENSEKASFPQTLSLQWEKVMQLRYGENPHQLAAFYRDSRSPLPAEGERPSIADAEILHGKALSYNNILDLDAALACCIEHKPGTAVVVKHTNPCGVASDDTGIDKAYLKARSCDPTSAFGGIVALNQEVTAALATHLTETFLECVVAPSYSSAAMEILSKKKNLRLTQLPALQWKPSDMQWTMRSVSGGMLLQAADSSRTIIEEAQVVTERKPTSEELLSLDFAWRVVKHVKSNAILFCKGEQTLAVGAGQMSRVDAAKLAVMKAQEALDGSVVASDAFFPFRDGIDALAAAGAIAVIQPGGSIRDKEVIEAANEHNMIMLFTGMRHFRH